MGCNSRKIGPNAEIELKEVRQAFTVNGWLALVEYAILRDQASGNRAVAIWMHLRSSRDPLHLTFELGTGGPATRVRLSIVRGASFGRASRHSL